MGAQEVSLPLESIPTGRGQDVAHPLCTGCLVAPVASHRRWDLAFPPQSCSLGTLVVPGKAQQPWGRGRRGALRGHRGLVAVGGHWCHHWGGAPEEEVPMNVTVGVFGLWTLHPSHILPSTSPPSRTQAAPAQDPQGLAPSPPLPPPPPLSFALFFLPFFLFF